MKNILALVLSLALMLIGIAAFAEVEGPTFEQMSRLEWSFSSGAGAWSTELDIAPDGSFKGSFHDGEMGETGDNYPNGTTYVCSFSGQLSQPERVDDLTWKVRVESLTPDDKPGQETIEDGARFVTADPYGISEGDEMTIYLPGTPISALTEDMRMWAHLLGEENHPAELKNWFMYSPKNESGFVGEPLEDDVSIANPWREMTREELESASGITLGVPEDAQNVAYRWLESDGLAEMQFTLDGDEYCARVQPATLSEGELMNISGMYFEWENEENITIENCYGTLGQARTGSEDWVELCQWYDASAGRMYSLSVFTTDPDGLDLTAVAQRVYKPEP